MALTRIDVLSYTKAYSINVNLKRVAGLVFLINSTDLIQVTLSINTSYLGGILSKKLIPILHCGYTFVSSQTLAKQEPGEFELSAYDRILRQFTGMPVLNETPCRIVKLSDL